MGVAYVEMCSVWLELWCSYSEAKGVKPDGSTFLKRNWSMKQVADETACVSKSRWSELQICCAGEARPLCQDP